MKISHKLKLNNQMQTKIVMNKENVEWQLQWLSTHWSPVSLYNIKNLVNIEPNNGLLPDGTKPLPVPI